MFEAVRNNKRIVQVFLLLITLPFAFWGVESYIRENQASKVVAKVSSTSISQQQFVQALREQNDNLRRRMGARFDPKLLEQPDFRLGLVNELVNQSLLNQEVERLRLVASDPALRQLIGSIPSFQENGQFSQSRYEAALASQGMTPTSFEARVRQELTLKQLIGSLAESGFVTQTIVKQLADLETETRSVQEVSFAPEQYLHSVHITPEAVKSFYDQNPKQFEKPEQIRVEYLVLSPPALRGQISVGETELRTAYENSKGRFQQADERRASHILIKNDEKNGGLAKEKAESLLKEAKANPGKFAALATQHSQDSGSAKRGGDLGFFAKGTMVRPFEETVWKMKEGEISGLVQSDFGFHVIKLTGIRGGKQQPYEAVKQQLEAEVTQQALTRKFAESAETFGNLVYEQADGLQTTADKFKLSVQRSNWLTRATLASDPLLGHPKLVGEIFSDEVLKKRHNSQVVEVRKDTLVAVRVAEYQPSSLESLDSVRGKIEQQLRQQEALQLAKNAAESTLSDLKAGKDSLTWSNVQDTSRLNSKNLHTEAVNAIFRLPNNKLPGYTLSKTPFGKGYHLYKLQKVSAQGLPESEATRTQKNIREQLERQLKQADLVIYLEALRHRYNVEIRQDVLMEGMSER